MLAAALTEGAANDWLALAVVDGFDVPNSTGALGFTVFIVAMTVMRFGGTSLLDRFGRLAVLRLCTVLAIVGLAIFGLVDGLPLAMVGAVLWGCGAALGFPVGMSAASTSPRAPPPGSRSCRRSGTRRSSSDRRCWGCSPTTSATGQRCWRCWCRWSPASSRCRLWHRRAEG